MCSTYEAGLQAYCRSLRVLLFVATQGSFSATTTNLPYEMVHFSFKSLETKLLLYIPANGRYVRAYMRWDNDGNVIIRDGDRRHTGRYIGGVATSGGRTRV